MSCPPMNDPLEIAQALLLIDQDAWDAAHEIVQRRSDPAACRVHALLHRMEGDDRNAGYWYRQAGVAFPEMDAADELKQLISEFSAG